MLIKDIIQRQKKTSIIITIDGIENYSENDFIFKKLCYISKDINVDMTCYIVNENEIIGFATIKEIGNNFIILNNDITKISPKPFKNFEGYRFFETNLINVL